MRPSLGAATAEDAIPRRIVCIETNMGIMPQFFFPDKPGRDYTSTPYLDRLKEYRDQLTGIPRG